MCISLNACFIVARLNDWINQKQDQPFHEWSFSEEQDGRDAGITVCTLLAQSGHGASALQMSAFGPKADIGSATLHSIQAIILSEIYVADTPWCELITSQ